MKLSGIFKYSFSLLYRKRISLLIHIFMMTVCVCLITYAYMNYYVVNEAVITVREMLETKPDNVYKITFDNRGTYNEETAQSIYNFCCDISVEDSEKSAIYYYDSCYFTDSYRMYGGETLCINSNALLLGDLYNLDGERISLDEGEVVVGYNYRDAMPKGSIWETGDGKKYIVKDILAKNEQWFPDIMLDEDIISCCLDDSFVIPINFELGKNDPYYGYIFQNGVYFLSEADYSRAESYFKKVGINNKCPITIYPVSDMIDKYIDTYREEYFITNFKTILMLILSLIGLFVVNIISLEKQKNILLIMYRYGVSRREHVIIHIFMQIIQSVIAVCLAYLFMYREYAVKYYNRLLYYNNTIAVSVISVLISIIVVEVITDKILVGYLNEVNRCE